MKKIKIPVLEANPGAVMLQVKTSKPTRLTQKHKILILMCRKPNKWFYAYEFMKPNLGELYVGYEAPTRIGDLKRLASNIFEQKQEDKYTQHKLNVAEIETWYELLPSDLKAIVKNNLKVGSL